MFQVFVLILHFFCFLFLSLFTFYPFGYLIIRKRKVKLDNEELVLFSFLITIVLFTLYAIFLGLLNLRFLMLPTLLSVFFYLFIKEKLAVFLPFEFLFKNKPLTFLIFLGILVQGFINFPSGYRYSSGLLFWSSQGHDGIWHIALMEEAKKTMPMVNPLYSGEKLFNYHYLFDIVMGEFGRIFPFFSSLDLYFRFFPVLLSFLISLSVYCFAKAWQKNSITAYLATSFTWLIGSFGFVVKYIHEKTIWGGETAFWASQGNTILGNPPHASAFAIIPAIFLSVLKYRDRRDVFWLWVTFLFGCLLAGFKVSAGVIVLVGLGVFGCLDFIRNKDPKIAVFSFLLGLSNIILISLITRDATSLLVFEPWWFVRTMVVSGDRLNWIDLELRRQFYLSLGSFKGILRVLQFELMAFSIFLIGNLGMRFVGFLVIFCDLMKKKGWLFRDVNLFVLVSALTAFLMPMLFVQKGITYNNIQYFQYFALIIGWFAAIFVSRVITGKISPGSKFLFLLIFILLSVPTVIGNFYEFYGPGKRPLAVVDNQLLEGLDFLKRNSRETSVVLTVPFDRYSYSRYKSLPFPIYAWYSTAYIPAIASRRTYLSSEEQLDITGYDIKERRILADKFFKTKDSEWQRKFLKENGIDYIFVAKDELEKDLNWKEIGLEEWFVNGSVKIYKVL